METTTDRLREAVRCHQTGEIKRAENIYQEILRLDPAHPDALHLLGVAELQRGETDSAIGRINRAISIRPDYDVYHANLAAAYRAAERKESAVRSLQRALEINPSSDETCLNLGNVLRELGRDDEALQFYRRALTINPNWPPLDSASRNSCRRRARLRRKRLSIVVFRRQTHCQFPQRPRSAPYCMWAADRTRPRICTNDFAARTGRRSVWILTLMFGPILLRR